MRLELEVSKSKICFNASFFITRFSFCVTKQSSTSKRGRACAQISVKPSSLLETTSHERYNRPSWKRRPKMHVSKSCRNDFFFLLPSQSASRPFLKHCKAAFEKGIPSRNDVANGLRSLRVLVVLRGPERIPSTSKTRRFLVPVNVS